MFVDPTMVIAIDRTGMAGDPDPLAFHGNLGNGPLGIFAYTEPVIEPLNRYATKSDYEDGQEPRGATLINSILGWDFVTHDASTEQASRLLVAEVRAAIGRIRFQVTVTVDGADPEVWSVQGRGSLTPTGARTRVDLTHHVPVWGISLPINPNRTIT